MRYTVLILIISLIAVSCGKDKYTSAPQIKFKSISPNTVVQGPITNAFPLITLNITDAEGDLTYKLKDTSKIFIKNLLINRIDSFPFPSQVESILTKNFQADIRISTVDVLQGSPRPRPKIDTVIFEIYVRDVAQNKSNVITTEPLYYVFP